MKLKTLSLFALMVIVPILIEDAPNAQAIMHVQGEQRPLLVSLTAPGSPYKLGMPIMVNIIVANTGKSAIPMIAETVPYTEYYGYRFTLMHNGAAVAKTNFHRAVMGEEGFEDPDVPLSGGINTGEMSAGSTATVPIDIRKIFLVTSPGTYVFSVEVLKVKGGNFATYNGPVQFTVIP